MRLSFILSQLDAVVEVRGPVDEVDINGVVNDSRHVKPGRLFVALPGVETDGRRFVEDAIKAGAVAVVSQVPVEQENSEVVYIQVKNAPYALGRIADVLYAKPSHTLKIAGITGTNGKTTTACLLHQIMCGAMRRVGLIGTVVYDDGRQSVPAERTTPSSHEIHRMLGTMRDNGCLGAVMEVSSHGLMQERVAAVRFDTAVFTNLSRDHLDYHGTMEDYYKAKERLSVMLANQRASGGKDGLLVINIDDVHGQRMARDFTGRVRLVTFGFGARCDFRTLRVQAGFNGTSFSLSAKGREFLVKTPLIGRHNIYNAMAALAATDGLELNFREAVKNIADTPQVPGRMERVIDRGPFRAFVDYAHTPDALENALKTLRELKPARIITVFGCGGDRDRQKRPMMGRVASQLSDMCILTSDNSRGEETKNIIRDIEEGITSRNYRAVEDRREAIEMAMRLAGDRDVVLVAGKGHETYQDEMGVRTPFDDRAEVRRAADRAPERGEET